MVVESADMRPGGGSGIQLLGGSGGNTGIHCTDPCTKYIGAIRCQIELAKSAPLGRIPKVLPPMIRVHSFFYFFVDLACIFLQVLHDFEYMLPFQHHRVFDPELLIPDHSLFVRVICIYMALADYLRVMIFSIFAFPVGYHRVSH